MLDVIFRPQYIVHNGLPIDGGLKDDGFISSKTKLFKQYDVGFAKINHFASSDLSIHLDSICYSTKHVPGDVDSVLVMLFTHVICHKLPLGRLDNYRTTGFAYFVSALVPYGIFVCVLTPCLYNEASTCGLDKKQVKINISSREFLSEHYYFGCKIIPWWLGLGFKPSA